MGLECVIAVEDGAKLILSAGAVNNASITVKDGGELDLQNNGKLYVPGSGSIEILNGGTLNINNGEIITHEYTQ